MGASSLATPSVHRKALTMTKATREGGTIEDVQHSAIGWTTRWSSLLNTIDSNDPPLAPRATRLLVRSPPFATFVGRSIELPATPIFLPFRSLPMIASEKAGRTSVVGWSKCQRQKAPSIRRKFNEARPIELSLGLWRRDGEGIRRCVERCHQLSFAIRRDYRLITWEPI